MNRRLRVALLLLLTSMVGHAKAQHASAFADTKLYDAVLDGLFQHVVQSGSPEVQLRYTYCDVGEMQIVIRRLMNSDFRLDISYLPLGAPNVWNQLAEMTNSNPKLSVNEAVASIKMVRTTLTIPNGSSLAKLLNESSSFSIPLLHQNTIALDGMAYGIAVRSLSEDLNLTLQGPQHSDESSTHLIRWMGQIRVAIRQALKEPGVSVSRPDVGRQPGY